jgi:hypothetical protein
MSCSLVFVPDFTPEQIERWNEILQNDGCYQSTLIKLQLAERFSRAFSDGSLVTSTVSPASFTSAYYHAFWLFEFISSLPQSGLNPFEVYFRFLDKAVNTRICYIRQLAAETATNCMEGKMPSFSER